MTNCPDLLGTLGWERSLGEGNGYRLQHSCLENSVDRGAWRATVHGVAKSQTRQLLSLSTAQQAISCNAL